MKKRETWGTRTGFIMAAVGSAVGLGNIWRFPYMAYENGGGAFLIPYLVAMLFAGIPFIILEYGLGQRFRGSAPKIFTSFTRRMEWFGWWQVLVGFIVASYYVVVISWAINYLALSFTLGWGSDPGNFFFKDFLGLTDSPMNLGGICWPVLIGMIIAWGVSYFAVFTGVRGGIERLNKIFMPVLFVLVLIFIGNGITLPGSADGLNWLFKPDFSAIMNVEVWASAFGQIFFSLSVGFSIMLSYSSYLPDDSDINNNSSMVVFINCGFSLISGIMIFSVLGYMANQQGVAVSEVANSGVGLAFVTMPIATGLMSMPELFSALFFAALVVAGLSSMVSLTEAITAGVMDKTGMSRKKASTITCLAGFVAGFAYAMNGGLYLLDIVDHFVNNYGVLLGALGEMIFVAWFCNLADMRNHVNRNSDFKVGTLWTLCLRFIAPIMLGTTTVMNFAKDMTENYEGYSDAAIFSFGWSMLLAILLSGVVISRFRWDFAELSNTNASFMRG